MKYRWRIFGVHLLFIFSATNLNEYDNYSLALIENLFTVLVFVNEWLVRNGCARVATFPPNVKHVNLFKEAEREARKNKRGIWGK